MAYTITLTFADDSTKEFTIGSDVDLPTGLNLTVTQITSLLNALSSLTRLMGVESWKTIQVESEED